MDGLAYAKLHWSERSRHEHRHRILRPRPHFPRHRNLGRRPRRRTPPPTGVNATLFKAAGPGINGHEVTLPCWKRSDTRTARLLRITRRGGWRVGLGSPYDIEQTLLRPPPPPPAPPAHRSTSSTSRTPKSPPSSTAPAAWASSKPASSSPTAPKNPSPSSRNSTTSTAPRPLAHAGSPSRRHPQTHLDRHPQLHRYRKPSPPPITHHPSLITHPFVPNSAFPETCPRHPAVAAIKRTHKRIDYLLSEFSALLAFHPPQPISSSPAATNPKPTTSSAKENKNSASA